MASLRVFADVKATTVESTTATMVPSVTTYPDQGPGFVAYSSTNDILAYRNTQGWQPLSVGSGSTTPAVTLADNIGFFPGARGIFSGSYASLTPTERTANLFSLAAGANITLTNINDTIVISGAAGGGALLLDGGTAPGHQSLVENSIGPNLATKGLVGGSGISLSSTATDVTINDTSNIATSGAGSSLVVTGANPNFVLRSIIGTNGVSVTQNANDITLAATTNLSSVGAGSTLIPAGGGTGPNLQIKSIIGTGAATNITNANDVTINVPNTTLTNVGTVPATGNLVVSSIGPGLSIRGLLGAGAAVLSQTGTDITITVPNTTNTSVGAGASLIPAGGGTGPSLQTKSIIGTGILTVTNNPNDITLNVPAGSSVTLTSVGAGASLVPAGGGTAPNLEVKSIIGIDAVSITNNANDITIDVATTTLGDSGANASLIVTGVGPNLDIKQLAAGSGIALTSNPTNVAISIPAGGVSSAQLANTTVVPGTYGSGTQVGQFIVNAEGQLTSATNVTITGAPPTGAAGGSLTGTYPNPGIANGVVANVNLVNSSLTVSPGAGLSGGGLVSLGGSTTLSIANGGVTNAMLQNSSLTVSSGAGLTGGGLVSLGGSTTLSIPNAGVTNAMLVNSSLSVTAGTGLSGGGSVSLGASTTINIANTAVVAGSYGSATLIPTFTVNAQGQLTAAGTVTNPVTTLANAGAGTSLVANGTGPALTVVSLSAGKGATVTLASNNISIASTGANTSIPVNLATTGTLASQPWATLVTYNATGGSTGFGNFVITYSSTPIIDGVNLALTQRILVKDQSATPTTGSPQNGIYSVVALAAGTLQLDRTSDSLTMTSMDVVPVLLGTVNSTTTFTCVSPNPITVGGAGGSNIGFQGSSLRYTPTALAIGSSAGINAFSTIDSNQSSFLGALTGGSGSSYTGCTYLGYSAGSASTLVQTGCTLLGSSANVSAGNASYRTTLGSTLTNSNDNSLVAGGNSIVYLAAASGGVTSGTTQQSGYYFNQPADTKNPAGTPYTMTVADVSPNNLIVAQSVTASGETWTVPTASAIKAAFPLTVTGTAFTFAINNLSNLDAITLAVNTGVTFGLQALNYIPQLATAVYKVTCTNAATPTFVFQLLSLSQSLVTTNNNILAGRNTNITNNSVSCVVLGNSTSSAASQCVVIGPSCTVTGSGSADCVVIGFSATSAAIEGISIGLNSTVGSSATAGVAIGNQSSSTGSTAVAVGSAASSSGNHATSYGNLCLSSGNQSVASGFQANAAGAFSTVTGATAGSSVAGGSSCSYGFNAQCTNISTIALGVNTTASNIGATVLGAGSTASGTSCTVIGFGMTNTANASCLIGGNGVSFLLTSSNATYAGVNQQGGYWSNNAANTNTSTGNYSLMATDIAPNSLIVANGVLVAGGNWTLPNATNYLSVFPLTTVNSACDFTLRNESAGAITILTNTGFTFGSGTYVIASNTTVRFTIVCTAIGGSPAFTLQRVGTMTL